MVAGHGHLPLTQQRTTATNGRTRGALRFQQPAHIAPLHGSTGARTDASQQVRGTGLTSRVEPDQRSGVRLPFNVAGQGAGEHVATVIGDCDTVGEGGTPRAAGIHGIALPSGVLAGNLQGEGGVGSGALRSLADVAAAVLDVGEVSVGNGRDDGEDGAVVGSTQETTGTGTVEFTDGGVVEHLGELGGFGGVVDQGNGGGTGDHGVTRALLDEDGGLRVDILGEDDDGIGETHGGGNGQEEEGGGDNGKPLEQFLLAFSLDEVMDSLGNCVFCVWREREASNEMVVVVDDRKNSEVQTKVACGGGERESRRCMQCVSGLKRASFSEPTNTQWQDAMLQGRACAIKVFERHPSN